MSACRFLETAAQGLRDGDASKVQGALGNLFGIFERRFPFRNKDPICIMASSLGIALMKKLFATYITELRFLEFALPAID